VANRFPRWQLPPVHTMFVIPDLHLESVRHAIRFGLLAALGAFILSLFVPYVGVFRKLELTTQDARMRLRGQRPLSPAIALIEIDEFSLLRYQNQWPIPRDQYAVLLAALAEQDVKALGIDLLFVGDDKYREDTKSNLPTSDEVLAAVIGRDPRVINAVYIPLVDSVGESSDPEGAAEDSARARWLRFTAPLPEGIELIRNVKDSNFDMQEDITEATATVGHVSLFQDVDGVVRSVPLLIDFKGRAFPALGLLMAARYLDADWRQIRFSRGHAILPTPAGEVRIPVDEHARMVISFPGGRELFRNHSSRHEFIRLIWESKGELADSLIENGGLKALRGKVALLCNTAATSAIADFGPTAFDPNFPLAYAHASVVNSIIGRGDYLLHIPRIVQMIFWALTALVLGVVMSVTAPVAFLLATVGAIFVYLVGGWAAAAFAGSVIEIVPPVLMIGMQAVAIGSRGYRLRDRQRRMQEQELAVAKKIQQDLLPRGALSFDGVEVMGFNLPCYAIGGDYFDYFKLGDGRIALAIADVAGKGVPAALLMSNLQAILRSETSRGSAVTEVPAQANRQLSESMGGSSKFVTFFYGAFDPAARRLSYSNAGHNPPLVVRADGRIEELEAGGLLLGVFPFAEYDEGTVDLEPGDLCVLFTDGVTEAENKTRDLYSDERLHELLRQHRGESATAIAQVISDDVARFSHGLHQSDDVTVIVVKVADRPALLPREQSPPAPAA
jgi:serine phosphatase RsbU (regulator of sigma subunit)